MPKRVRFTCPHCQASFQVLRNADQFICLSCKNHFGVVKLGKGKRGWIQVAMGEDLGGAWAKAGTQEIHIFGAKLAERRRSKKPQAGDIPQIGAARARRERRRNGRANTPALTGFLLVLLVGLALLFPIVAQGRSFQSPGPEVTYLEYTNQSTTTNVMTVSPSATLIPTSTPLPTKTPTPTETPLPERLIAATAWQATLDQATFYSHATQTQSVESYSATQTSLPFTVTAAATQRAATATQKAISATEKASSRP